ncbi:SDR family oxidoreductase [Clostridium mediterraneense]|uniref:SDR family oxidoreductase n=1 Tax=Clostridium mediterraneense TaxID=1805472 RepID=UPI000834F03D|nr:SDR family oxidoreductase [Clostridium mediterraneense]
MTIVDKFPDKFPAQHQDVQPGSEEKMAPQPIYEAGEYSYSCDRLKDKVAIITGGDSGIGRAVSLAYAREGAKVVIAYLNEEEDAKKTEKLIIERGGECLLIGGDICEENHCKEIVDKTVKQFGCVDILVNNAGVQYPQDKIEDISCEQLEKTFKTNIFASFHLVKAALPHMKKNSCIINTSSVVAYKGNKALIDYSATKGAVTSFTRSLAMNLAPKQIRVNAVAPGPIWTPLIVSSFDKKKVSEFSDNLPFNRAGQPVELAESYVFLASQGASYITGETIHVNGGEMITS